MFCHENIGGGDCAIASFFCKLEGERKKRFVVLFNGEGTHLEKLFLRVPDSFGGDFIFVYLAGGSRRARFHGEP